MPFNPKLLYDLAVEYVSQNFLDQNIKKLVEHTTDNIKWDLILLLAGNEKRTSLAQFLKQEPCFEALFKLQKGNKYQMMSVITRGNKAFSTGQTLLPMYEYFVKEELNYHKNRDTVDVKEFYEYLKIPVAYALFLTDCGLCEEAKEILSELNIAITHIKCRIDLPISEKTHLNEWVIYILEFSLANTMLDVSRAKTYYFNYKMRVDLLNKCNNKSLLLLYLVECSKHALTLSNFTRAAQHIQEAISHLTNLHRQNKSIDNEVPLQIFVMILRQGWKVTLAKGELSLSKNFIEMAMCLSYKLDKNSLIKEECMSDFAHHLFVHDEIMWSKNLASEATWKWSLAMNFLPNLKTIACLQRQIEFRQAFKDEELEPFTYWPTCQLDEMELKMHGCNVAETGLLRAYFLRQYAGVYSNMALDQYDFPTLKYQKNNLI